MQSERRPLKSFSVEWGSLRSILSESYQRCTPLLESPSVDRKQCHRQRRYWSGSTRTPPEPPAVVDVVAMDRPNCRRVKSSRRLVGEDECRGHERPAPYLRTQVKSRCYTVPIESPLSEAALTPTSRSHQSQH